MKRYDSGYFKGELLFKEEAKQFFNFPIKNPIRLSIWTENGQHSTPSEITSDQPIYVAETYTVEVSFMRHGIYLNADTSPGTIYQFKAGLIVYGIVKII